METGCVGLVVSSCLILSVIYLLLGVVKEEKAPLSTQAAVVKLEVAKNSKSGSAVICPKVLNQRFFFNLDQIVPPVQIPQFIEYGGLSDTISH